MTLGAALRSPRSQNLDMLRLLLALAVICSHAWPLSLGPGAVEPLEHLTGRSLGGWAVGVFFFISGLLITASATRKTQREFWRARIRRILPGLGLALVITLTLAVASGSSVGLQQAGFWFLRAITLVSIEHRLPDAFDANPYPEVVNGPLWSLFHEVFAYAICAAFVWCGGTRHPKVVLLLGALAAGAALMQDSLPGRFATFVPLFFAFSAGMAAYIWRNHIPLRVANLLTVLLIAYAGPLPLSLAAAGLGLVGLVLLAPTVRLASDTSFGLYIYGWPIAQCLVALIPGIAPLHLAVLSILVTYPIALLSWHVAERPNLVLRFGRV